MCTFLAFLFQSSSLNVLVLVQGVSRIPTSALYRMWWEGYIIRHIQSNSFIHVTYGASVSDINEMQQLSCFKQVTKNAFVLECMFAVFTICETVHIAHSLSAVRFLWLFPT